MLAICQTNWIKRNSVSIKSPRKYIYLVLIWFIQTIAIAQPQIHSSLCLWEIHGLLCIWPIALIARWLVWNCELWPKTTRQYDRFGGLPYPAQYGSRWVKWKRKSNCSELIFILFLTRRENVMCTQMLVSVVNSSKSVHHGIPLFKHQQKLYAWFLLDIHTM